MSSSEQVCRTCLRLSSPEETFADVNGANIQQNITFREKLKKCVPELTLADTESADICSSCIALLESAFVFRNMCLTTEEKLRKMSSAFYTDLAKLAKGSPKSPLRDSNAGSSRNISLNDSSYVVGIEQNLAISIAKKEVTVPKMQRKSEPQSHRSRNKNCDGSKRRLSDKEILENACKSIEELRDLSPDMLDCAVALEKVPVPVDAPENTPTFSDVSDNLPLISYVAKKEEVETTSSSKRKRSKRPPRLTAVKKSGEKRRRSERQSKTSENPPKLYQEVDTHVPENPPKKKRTKILETRVRTKKGLYCCLYCPKLSRSMSKCLVHERAIHTKETPYVCEVCNKGFYANYMLNAHLNVHKNGISVQKERPKERPVERHTGPNPLSPYQTRNKTPKRPPTVPPSTSTAAAEAPTQAPKEATPLIVRVKREVVEQTSEFVDVVNAGAFENGPAINGIKIEVEASDTSVHGDQGEAEMDAATAGTSGAPELQFNCAWCRISYNNAESLSTHMKTHKCSLCDLTFATDSERDHHSQTHISYACDICGEPFPSNEERSTHQTHHFPGGKRKKNRIFCLWCKYWVSTKDHFNVHTGNKPYKCEVCGKGFASKSTLYGHKFVHTDERPYNCALCKRGFTKKYNYLVHKKTHRNHVAKSLSPQKSPVEVNGPPLDASWGRSEEPDFACEVCKTSYPSQLQLDEHICLNAQGERVFSCQICKDALVGRSAFIEHVKKHFVQTEQDSIEQSLREHVPGGSST